MDRLTNKLTIADRWLPVVYLILMAGLCIACLLAEKERVRQNHPVCSTECYVCFHQPRPTPEPRHTMGLT